VTVDDGMSTLTRIYDLIDAGEVDEVLTHLADDLQFEVMLPGSPPSRIYGGKADFAAMVEQVGTGRRHEVDTVATIGSIELVVGRRGATLLAAAQIDTDGRLARYAEVLSDDVEFSDVADRVAPAPNLLQSYFDRVDAVSLDEAIDLVADDYQFEMVFPGLTAQLPDDRNSRSKTDFRAFQAEIRSRNPRSTTPISQTDRRHHTRVATVAENLIVVVAETINGRRNGTIIAATEADTDGHMKRYLIGMTPTVTFDFAPV
jgi:ketosteroid isomerase-like protein